MTDHVGATLLHTADPTLRAEVGGQWAQPVLAADGPWQITSIDLPTATKAQLQEVGVFSPHEGCPWSTQLGR